MNKNKIIIIISCIILICGISLKFYKDYKNKENLSFDALKFKEEYEHLNGVENYISLNLKNTSSIIYKS